MDYQNKEDKMEIQYNIETDKQICPYCQKEYSKYGIKNHIRITHNNEKAPMTRKKAWNKGLTKDTDDRVKKCGETFSKNYKEGKIELNNYPSEETKNKISESMKKAHKEGRAHNIGKCRWNNEMSYPEKFFKQVIDNEFEDKNYVQEYNVSIYSIDFAWVDKKLAIEIDGEQHEKPDVKERDIRKDKKLKEEGWKVLRIKWKDMFHNTKDWIQIVKDFIH
jgi:very-short-patch-repair endonuclease